MSLTWTKQTLTAEAVDDLKSEIAGKNVLITGVTVGGLGFEAAYNIGKYANALILVGSNLERLQKSEDKINEAFKQVKIHKIVVDLGSLKAVSGAAAEINGLGLPIHVVIANATPAVRKEYAVSADGYEAQFAVSHLAHFVLINSILPRVLDARSDAYSPRIVMVSSVAHMFGAVHLDDTSFGDGKEYKPQVAYSQTKSANVLYSKEVARRLASKGVISFSLHPGAVPTNGYEGLPDEERNALGSLFMKPDGTLNEELITMKSLEAGALSYVVAAFDPRIKDRSGSYLWDDGQIRDELVAPHASDPKIAQQLWALSEKMVGKTFDI